MMIKKQHMMIDIFEQELDEHREVS
jgi:hypothetical protein